MNSVMEDKVRQKLPWVGSYENPVEALKQAEADNAALVEMLAQVFCALNQEKHPARSLQVEEVAVDNEDSLYPAILDLLAQPHPGWALVEQLTKLKQVAEAARPFLNMDRRQDVQTYHDQLGALGKAFVELDDLNEGRTIKDADHAEEP